MKSIFQQLRSFRLGYTEEHRRVPCFFVVSMEVDHPHRAGISRRSECCSSTLPYNIVQEFTYRPNDTLPAVALSSLVPSVFQLSANSFTPQLLTVGDVIKLNGSLFEYTIVDAFDGLDETKPVSSFSYHNNPFSDGCDVTDVTINVGLTRVGEGSRWVPQYEMLAQVAITCRVPTLFHLVWSGVPPTTTAAGFVPLENIANLMFVDIYSMFYTWYFVTPIFPPFSLNGMAWTGYHNATMVNITVTAHAYCHCDPAGSPETTTLLEPPCSSTPPRFMATEAYSMYKEAEVIFLGAYVANQTHPLMSTEALEKLAGWLGNVSTPDFTSTFQNIFQTTYHLVRLDLGVIIDNQIYNSPQMFNLRIMPLDLPYSSLNESRITTSNSTLMAQWRHRVAFYQNESVKSNL
ncbi:hypothetical protein DFH08DRAFT_822404 [Mycena albidolilacea]|uniref:Uncharacterized protein n=1 Tax=Mycena albidolilacea TaxID=1033008 RepID=A0AAD6Z837_9AGAR|nr:hypothetical protein DFH08DRAFT_822404 [Mycena albidolilacea]